MKALRVLGYLVGGVVVAAGGFVGWCAIDGIPHYAVPAVQAKVEVTPERVARGHKLASLLCAQCHRDPTTGKLTGRRLDDMPTQFGDAFSRNITQHPVNGIGKYTDGQLVGLLRTGIASDGRYTPPWMVKLPHASDEDIYSLVAFLRSDDPMVQAVDVPNRDSHPSLLAKVLTHTVFKPLALPTGPIAAPPRSDAVAYGRYLMTSALECHGCHSADFKTVNVDEPAKSVGFFGGDNELVGMSGELVYSANLTPDDETGLGSWTEAQFRRALRDGIRPDNTLVRYPMSPMRDLDDDDIAAMYAYERTLPKIHKRPRANQQTTLQPNASNGQKVYYKYGCNSCHGENGVGTGDLRGAF
ncbi:MAG: putative diheme cytochrome c-553, partial [Myxococcales bacterium]|nr:putative diheme cytochrome c-553 [Myxococcales bacterium]